ncbi:Cytochrome oxidase biogenesis protein Surf1,facilitates heme A insertion [Pseudoalteromonas luteoviolacea B = ATCC 29581]|nr:Cytochrome oxidase biogenesis protein Surf1,facilitates heme A insertion [Pseudoalteromonas luteoviolacea B = ATCC 29581]
MKKKQLSKLSVSWLTLAASIVVFVCLGLAYWQFERGKNKETLLAGQIDKGALVTALIENKGELSDLHGGIFTINGRWVENAYWLLDNQIVDGKPGYDLIVPFILLNDQIVLINLGFVAASAPRALPSKLPDVQKLPLQFEVTLKVKNLKGFTLAASATHPSDLEGVVQFLDLNYLSQGVSRDLVPAVAYAQQSLDPLLTPHFQLSTMSPQKHFGYAVQWFLLAVAAALVAYFAQKSQQRSLVHEE